MTKHHYFNVLHNIASDFHSRISGSRELKPANSPNSSQVFKIDQPEWDRILAMKVFNETCSEEPDRYVNRDILHAEIFHLDTKKELNINEWLDDYLIRLPALKNFIDGPGLITLGHHANSKDASPVFWSATEWLDESADVIKPEEMANLLLNQHKFTFNGIRVNLQAEAPYWSWKKWTDALLGMLKDHPICANKQAQNAVLILKQLAKKSMPTTATITHGDIHPNNLKKRNNTFLLFDWEELAIAPSERDIGIMIERYIYASEGFPNIQKTLFLYQQGKKLCEHAIVFYAFLAKFKRSMQKGLNFPDNQFLTEVNLVIHSREHSII